MTKFGDKLTRLHSSRVRALETDSNGEEKRVFVAEPEAPPAAPEAKPAPTDSPARRAVRQQLEVGERLGGRTTARKPRTQAPRPAGAIEPPAVMGREPGAEQAIGERLGDLRRQADALLNVGAPEPALPMLHEMVALSPTHPWALKHLCAYWKSRGETKLAAYYADRLAAVAPY